MDFDKEYIDFILGKAFKIHITNKKSGSNNFLTIDFVFNEKDLAYTCLYYLLFRLSNTRIEFALEISKDNKLTITFNVIEKKTKIIIESNSKSFNLIETNSFITESPPYEDVIAFLSCKYQEKFEIKPMFIIDKKLGDMPMGAIRVYAYKYGNDGLELFPPESPPL